jgi:hypothetical protein
VNDQQSQGYAWRDRPPSKGEVERLRLVLSAFQDGSGTERAPDGKTRAGWLQVERALAEVFGGITQENKGVFDVLIDASGDKQFGLSVKTSQRRSDDRVLMELANSEAKFRAAAEKDEVDWQADPSGSGKSVLEEVRRWHRAVEADVDVDRSSYVIMTHDRGRMRHELFWWPLALPDAEGLSWSRPDKRGSSGTPGRAIVGQEEEGRLVEFYPWSGGQLKLFPRGDSAQWRSGQFELESPPTTSLAGRAAEYWPEKWKQAGGQA